jgi:hypothetical protein
MMTEVVVGPSPNGPTLQLRDPALVRQLARMTAHCEYLLRNNSPFARSREAIESDIVRANKLLGVEAGLGI